MATIDLRWQVQNDRVASQSFAARVREARELERVNQRLIAQQRQLAAARRRAAQSNGRGPQASQNARIAREAVLAEQAARRSERSAQRASNSFREFSQSVAGTGQQLTGVQQRLQQYRQANVQLAQSLGLPVSSIRSLNTSLGTLPDRTAAVASSYIQLRDAGVSGREAFSQLNQEFGLSQQQFQSLEQTIGASTLALGSLAVAARRVTTSIAGIFQGGFRDFLAVEGTFNALSAITGQTREEIAGLEQEATRLGATTAKSNRDVAATAVTMIRLGFSAEEAQAALSGVVEGSLASGESLNTVGRITAQVVNQFSDLEAASANVISDTIVATANNSAASVGSLGQALSFVGGEANRLDQSLSGTATAIGLLSDAGIPAGRAGRNLTQVLTRLDSASATNTENFQRLGVAVRDSQGEFRPLLDIIPEIRDRINELDAGGTGAGGALINRLFGTQGARALNALIGRTDEQIDELRQTIANAAGSSTEAANVLQQGLPGALSRLESATETASAAIGRSLAPAAEAAVNAAQALVSGFASLPAPIQQALVATTAFTGILAAAVAAIAGYAAASRVLQLNQVALAASQVANTAATAANTVVVGANAIAQANLRTVLTQVVAGFNAATASVAGNSAAIGGSAIAIARFAAQIAVLVAALRTIQIAASRFSDGGEEIRDASDEIRQGLIDIQAEAGEAAESIESAIPSGPPPTDFVDGIVVQFNRLNSFLNNLTGLPEDFLRIPTNAERSIDGARLAIADLSESVFELTDRAQDLATGFSGTEDELRQAAAIQELFSQAIAGTQARLAALDASELGQDAYIELSGQLRTNIALLEQQRDAFIGQISPAEEAADTITESTRQTREELEATAEAIERQRDALREASEEEFRVQATAETDVFRNRQRQEDLQFRRQQQAEDRAFQADQAAREQALQDELQADQDVFNQGQADQTRALQDELQSAEEAFNRSQQAARSAFEDRLNQQRRTFEDELSQQRADGEAEISARRQELEREQLLEQADGRDERQALEARFEEEDEAAARRQEIEDELAVLRRQLDDELRAEEEAFAARQQAQQLKFQATQESQRETFEETLNQRRIELEGELATAREAFEEQLAARRRELALQLEEERIQFQQAQEDANFAREIAQQEVQRQFEATQRQAEATFKDEQRRLDEESAERVKGILESTAIAAPGDVPGFKEGTGPAGAPGGLAVVGEAGPELVRLPRGAAIASNFNSMAGVQAAIRQNPQLARPFISSSGFGGFQGTAIAPSSAIVQQGLGGNNRRLESLLVQSNQLLSQNLAANSQGALFGQQTVRGVDAIARAANGKVPFSERMSRRNGARPTQLDPLDFLRGI